jgi:hypothetical protein
MASNGRVHVAGCWTAGAQRCGPGRVVADGNRQGLAGESTDRWEKRRLAGRAAAEGVREALGGQRPPERQRASRSSGRGASGGGAGAAGNRVSGPESKS